MAVEVTRSHSEPVGGFYVLVVRVRGTGDGLGPPTRELRLFKVQRTG